MSEDRNEDIVGCYKRNAEELETHSIFFSLSFSEKICDIHGMTLGPKRVISFE